MRIPRLALCYLGLYGSFCRRTRKWDSGCPRAIYKNIKEGRYQYISMLVICCASENI